MKAYLRKSSSLCLSTGTHRKVSSLSTRDLKRVTNKRVKAPASGAPDLQGHEFVRQN